MRWGKTPCDGKLTPGHCTELHRFSIAGSLAGSPASSGRFPKSCPPESGSPHPPSIGARVDGVAYATRLDRLVGKPASIRL